MRLHSQKIILAAVSVFSRFGGFKIPIYVFVGVFERLMLNFVSKYVNATNERSDRLIVENNLASRATLNASVVVGVRKNETGVDAVVAVFFVSFVM